MCRHTIQPKTYDLRWDYSVDYSARFESQIRVSDLSDRFEWQISVRVFHLIITINRNTLVMWNLSSWNKLAMWNLNF